MDFVILNYKWIKVNIHLIKFIFFFFLFCFVFVVIIRHLTLYKIIIIIKELFMFLKLFDLSFKKWINILFKQVNLGSIRIR
jgi:hypothetical protein